MAWMETPGAIAALSAIAGGARPVRLRMFGPLKTAGKADMAEQSVSDVEELLRDIMEDPDRAAWCSPSAHIEMSD